MQQWKNNQNIPFPLRDLGPIIILDNWSANHVIDSSGIDFKYLPHYSPFINPAEFINRDHKAGI